MVSGMSRPAEYAAVLPTMPVRAAVIGLRKTCAVSAKSNVKHASGVILNTAKIVFVMSFMRERFGKL